MNAINVLQKSIMSYPLGSKKHQALIRSVSALTPHFNMQSDQSLQPAAARKMMETAKTGGQMGTGMGPPGLTPAPAIRPPTMAPMEMPGGGA